MDKSTDHWPQSYPLPWLLLALVGGLLAIAPPAYSGSAPSGAGSGVNPSGSFNVGREQRLESNTPNATVNPTTGELVLTATAQQSLNQTAGEIIQGLQSTNPALANALTTSATIDLNSPSPAEAVTVGGSGVGAEKTVGEIAAMAVAAINSGTRFALTSDQGTLSIEPSTALSPGTSAVFTPLSGGTPLVVPLTGTQAQIANAAGFLAAAFAAGLPPQQITPFIAMALDGANYLLLVPLFNAVGGLLPPQPQSDGAVSATQLEAAIQAYNRILNDSDPATLAALNQNQDFVSLGRSLQQLRAAIDN